MFEPEPVGWGADLDPHRPPDRLTHPDLMAGGTMRRIDESIESLAPGVATGVAPGEACGGRGVTAPLAFRWRGRRYVVGTVLAHWVETGAWWRRTAPQSVSDELPDPERRLWRVEACRGAQTGVFDLCLEVDPLAPAGPPRTERWSLHAIYD